MTREFIVLEGPSGAGKSTQIEKLKQKFPAAVFGVEPTHQLFGAVIRSLYERRPVPNEESDSCLKYGDKSSSFWVTIHHFVNQVKHGLPLGELEMQLFYIADRVYDLKENILPALAAGKMFVLDRYLFSTLAIGPSGGVGLEDLLQWQLKAFKESNIPDEVWKPDLVVIFDIDPRIGMERLKSSGKVIDIFEEKIERMEKIRGNSRELAKRDDLAKKIALLDASRPIEIVTYDLMGVISSLNTAA